MAQLHSAGWAAPHSLMKWAALAAVDSGVCFLSARSIACLLLKPLKVSFSEGDFSTKSL